MDQLAVHSSALSRRAFVGRLAAVAGALGAPLLADMVKAGKLPPVEQRVPDEPLVIKPLQGTGKFGGTLRRAFTGPGDNENGNRWVSMDKPLFWDYTGTKQMPAVAKSWELAD